MYGGGRVYENALKSFPQFYYTPKTTLEKKKNSLRKCETNKKLTHLRAYLRVEWQSIHKGKKKNSWPRHSLQIKL